MLRVGLARLVMTTMRPGFSTMKRRLVSPGGDAMPTGLVKFILLNALLHVNVSSGGAGGKLNVVFATRCKGPACRVETIPTSSSRRISARRQGFIRRILRDGQDPSKHMKG